MALIPFNVEVHPSPTIQKDVYKEFHRLAAHPDVEEMYANFTNRSGAYNPDNKLGGVINVGLQYVIMDYLLSDWNSGFFNVTKKFAVQYHKRILSSMLGYQVDVEYLEDLHDLGYLPLEIRSLPEGMIVPYGVPSFTIRSTHKKFQWLVLAIETAVSCETWGIQTSATTAANYKMNFIKAGRRTGIPEDFYGWQGHDFSMRGMFGRHAAAASGFGHLTSLYGTDTTPAIAFAERWYGADVDTDLVGGSVNATEHSVTCTWQKEGELAFLDYLMGIAPEGILSIVADTWDFWHLVTVLLPQRKEQILARKGKIVIRPDSGDPVEILCGIRPEGLIKSSTGKYTRVHRSLDKHGNKVVAYGASASDAEVKGLVECLYDIFGGTVVEVDGTNYKHLNEKIGAIYGDSITLARQLEIQKQLTDKGYAPSVVLGIGSYTYQYVTRDTNGSAMKATSVVKAGVREAIFKQPKTDSGKTSAKGLLMVVRKGGKLSLLEDVTEAQEASEANLLKTVFLDGKLVKTTTLKEIRALITAQIEVLLRK